MISSKWVVPVIITVFAATLQMGRRDRRSGRPHSPRTTVMVMAKAWALAWLAIGLTSLPGGPATWTWREPLALLGLAGAPLVLILAAIHLPSINSAAMDAGKKLLPRHPLD